MIGVISKGFQEAAISEFFELFKTPWEFYGDAHDYDAVVCTDGNYNIKEIHAKLVVIYNSEKTLFDPLHQINLRLGKPRGTFVYKEMEFPLYGNVATFDDGKDPLIMSREGNEVAGMEIILENTKIIRVGFDLFYEVSFLLSSGQPVDLSGIPTMEIHISMLREWILNSGVPLTEIPPIPPGYAFIVCLTHDVDFIGIRNHKFDHTMWGFIYRAILGSFMRLFTDRSAWRKLLTNWKAVLVLPLVYLGMIKDFWDDFDRYLEIEKDLGSTFFVIPFKNRSGKDGLGREQRRRAVRYDISDMRPVIQRLMANGCEIGLHGINAWCDAQNGNEEAGRIREEVGKPETGVRMHWLYYSDHSPEFLEEAGFIYDSTLGYNEAVGYRGGTTQVFRPLSARTLLELPLHIQDTALFYPGRMALTEKKGFDLVRELIKDAQEYGGVLTINWHTRSLSPERLWDTFYIDLLEELKVKKVWFATGQQAVTWFKKRRSVSFEEDRVIDNGIHIKTTVTDDTFTPDLLLRVHHQGLQSSQNDYKGQMEIPFSNNLDLVIPLPTVQRSC